MTTVILGLALIVLVAVAVPVLEATLSLAEAIRPLVEIGLKARK